LALSQGQNSGGGKKTGCEAVDELSRKKTFMLVCKIKDISNLACVHHNSQVKGLDSESEQSISQGSLAMRSNHNPVKPTFVKGLAAGLEDRKQNYELYIDLELRDLSPYMYAIPYIECVPAEIPTCSLTMSGRRVP